MGAITPFIVLLIVALIFNYIPMDGKLKQIGYIIIGIVAIVLLLKLAGIL
jgi:Na+/phosphate symporter